MTYDHFFTYVDPVGFSIFTFGASIIMWYADFPAGIMGKTLPSLMTSA